MNDLKTQSSASQLLEQTGHRAVGAANPSPLGSATDLACSRLLWPLKEDNLHRVRRVETCAEEIS